MDEIRKFHFQQDYLGCVDDEANIAKLSVRLQGGRGGTPKDYIGLQGEGSSLSDSITYAKNHKKPRLLLMKTKSLILTKNDKRKNIP